MIQTINVSLSYNNGVHALRNVSVRIAKGDFVFIVGPTGSGKSSFLKLINREEAPTSGQVLVAGKDVVRLRPRQVPGLRRSVVAVECRLRAARHRRAGPGGPPPHQRRPRGRQSGHEGGRLPARDQRRRAAARLHRSRHRQQPPHPAGRRADRQPRPGYLLGDHQCPRADPAQGHHRGRRQPRQNDRGPAAEAGGRIRPRQSRPGRARRPLRR